MSQAFDFNSNIYLSVTLSPGSSLLSTPENPGVLSLLAYHGKVGALRDVRLYSFPKPNWDNVHEEVLSAIRNREGVVRVEVIPEPRRRSKRDEL